MGIKEATNYIVRNIFNKLKQKSIQKIDAYFLGLYLEKLPNKFQKEDNCQCFNYFGKRFYKQKIFYSPIV